jgi:putative peptide zinc metalloprotease protein
VEAQLRSDDNNLFNLALPLHLADDIKIFEVDHETLLFHEQTKKYFKIGKLSKAILLKLQSHHLTGEQLIRLLSEELQISGDAIAKNVCAFLKQMATTGIISTEATDFETSPSPRSRRRTGSLVKLFRIRHFDPFLGKMAKALPNLNRRIIAFTLPLLSVIFLSFILYALRKNFVEKMSGTAYLYLLPWVSLHLIGHELCHALVCKKVGGRIREAGMGLLYFVIPVGYVDLTDTYQLEGKKRAFIAMAGPFFDLSAGFITSLFVLHSNGFTHTTAVHLLLLQFLIFCLNCNLLLPSDLYRTLEHWTKSTNLRKHSFDYLKSVLLNKEKPVYLKRISGIRENFYLLYAALSSFYILSLIIFFIFIYINFFLAHV